MVMIIDILCIGADWFCKLHPGPPAVQETWLPNTAHSAG